MKTKTFTLILSLCFLFIIAGTQNVSAQCSYVVSGTSNDTTISIPCDFPVLMNTGNATADASAYQGAVAQWNTNHPALTAVSVMPQPVATSTTIQIPASTFANFSTDRQATMQRFTFYYKVNP